MMTSHYPICTFTNFQIFVESEIIHGILSVGTEGDCGSDCEPGYHNFGPNRQSAEDQKDNGDFLEDIDFISLNVSPRVGSPGPDSRASLFACFVRPLLGSAAAS